MIPSPPNPTPANPTPPNPTAPGRSGTTSPTRRDRRSRLLSPITPVLERDGPAGGDWARTGRRSRAMRLSPFVILCLLAYPLAALAPGASEHRMALVVAAVLVLAAGLQAMLIPWQHLPPVTRQLPVLTLCLSVMALRQATGGSADGYGATLLLIPVVWQGLYGRRIDVAFTIATIALSLVTTPMLLGGYPTRTEFPRSLLLILVATTLGGILQGLIERVRANDEALRQIGTVSRLLHSSADPRQILCDSLLSLTGGSLVLVSEARGDHHVATASEGTIPGPGGDMAPDDVHPALVTVVAEVLEDGELRLVPGARVGPSAVDQLHVPIGPPGTPFGVVSVLWASDRAAPPLGTLRGLALLGTDAGLAIEKADLVSALADQANQDGLTGIPNRRAWDLLLERAVTETTQAGRPLSVAMIDLDHFKAYNDEFGHLAGDDLLRDAVTAWSGVLRPGDVLARWGGEEFAVMFPGATSVNAARALHRLRDVTPGSVSFSAGVAQMRPQEDPEDLVGRADEAMYRAKAAGRDRVVVSTEQDAEEDGPERIGSVRS